jgi:hypothetical protein
VIDTILNKRKISSGFLSYSFINIYVKSAIFLVLDWSMFKAVLVKIQSLSLSLSLSLSHTHTHTHTHKYMLTNMCVPPHT